MPHLGDTFRRNIFGVGALSHNVIGRALHTSPLRGLRREASALAESRVA